MSIFVGRAARIPLYSILKDDHYVNVTERMIDINNSEKMRLELESLRNKKDVIYVDALKVKEELIKEWGKERVKIEVDEPIVRDEIVEETNEVIIEDEPIQTIEVKEEIEETIEKKNKVELDW